MNVLSVAEVEGWLNNHNLAWYGDDLRHSEHLVLPTDGYRSVTGTECHPRNQFLIAFELTKWLDASETLMWMSGWTADKWMNELFVRIREKRGCSGLILDFPGHLFLDSTPGDDELIGTFTMMMMAINWECYFVSQDVTKIIWMADGVVDVYAKHSSDMKVWQERLKYIENIDCYDFDDEPETETEEA